MRLGLQPASFTYRGGAGAIRGTLVEIAQAAAGRRLTREGGRGVLPSRPGRLLLPRSFRPRLTTL